MNKQELINKINEIDNIFKYSIKGGTSMFNKEHPKLLEHINNNTTEIQIYVNNKKLLAKLLYLKKYKGNIEKIKYENSIMIFDNKIKDFKCANINAAQKQWDISKIELSNISEIYTKEETINLLKDNYIKYLGKSGNRKLLRDNKKLYLSLFYHTSNLNNLNKNLNKFSMRLYILINNLDIVCSIHNCLKFWTINKGEFKIVCGNCKPKYPSIEWFKNTYGDDWKKFNDERIISIANNRTNSIFWFKKKYGDTLGTEKYHSHVEYKMSKLSELKGNKYSKISQELFWNIYNNLNDKSGIYFHDLNCEFVLRIPSQFEYKNTVMMLDFKQNFKIIEYNGNYWHSKVIDDVRYSILKKMGFEVMIITSDEYNRNKKNKLIVDKCVKFLEC